jgi:hypothetical protein
MQSKEWNNTSLTEKFLTIGNLNQIQSVDPRMLFLANIHLNHVFPKYLSIC